MMWDDGHGWGAGAWVGMALIMLLFWGGLIALLIVFLRTGGWGRHEPPPPPPAPPERQDPTAEAERILHERFARGEIDEEEYTRKRDLLRSR